MTRTLHGSRAARWKEAERIAFLTALSLIMFFPIFWMVLSSVKAPSEVIKRSVFWPSTLYWENYVVAFNAAPFGRYFINSFTMAALTVMAQVITGSLAGFGFAKMRFRLNKPLFLLFLCSMMIPSEATIISNYLTISAMGLLDTYLSVIITSFVSVSRCSCSGSST